MLADKLGGSAGFISSLLLHCMWLLDFKGSVVKGNKRFMQAGQTHGAESLNTDLRFLAAKRIGNRQRAHQYVRAECKEICDLGKLATIRDICDTSRTDKVKI